MFKSASSYKLYWQIVCVCFDPKALAHYSNLADAGLSPEQHAAHVLVAAYAMDANKCEDNVAAVQTAHFHAAFAQVIISSVLVFLLPTRNYSSSS